MVISLFLYTPTLFDDPTNSSIPNLISGSRPIRVSVATPKNRQPQIPHYTQLSALYPIYGSPPPRQDYPTSLPAGVGIPTSPTLSHSTFDQMQNTTVFVGGLYAHVTEQELSRYGLEMELQSFDSLIIFTLIII
jgi:hypothetical protein